MCINPVRLLNGQEVACHKCWQCVRRKVDDWTGRCIAEAHTAAQAVSVTLTYGQDLRIGGTDHLRAAVLTYSDFQRYARAWRDDGQKVRYFVVGEYGSTKGRAHWHAILYFERPVQRPMQEQFSDEFWPHGFSFWQPATPETVRYVCKYIVKEVETDERLFHMGLSKLPPLGDRFFRNLAASHVAQRLAPRDLFYSFPGVVDRKGRPRQFQMQGKTRENFLREFRDLWWSTYGDHPPPCDLVEQFEDDEAKRGDAEEARKILAFEKAGAVKLRDHGIGQDFTGTVGKPNPGDLRSWMDPERLHFSESLNVWLYEFEGEQRPWYWAKDAEGVWSWRAKIGASHPVPKPHYATSGRRGR